MYQHFKLESLSDVFKIIHPNCWMTSVGIRNHGVSLVVGPKHVPDNDTVVCRLLHHSPTQERQIDTTTPQEQITSTVSQTPASSHTFTRKLSKSSVSPGETQQHFDMKVHSKQEKLQRERDVDPLLADMKTLLGFLHLYVQTLMQVQWYLRSQKCTFQSCNYTCI